MDILGFLRPVKTIGADELRRRLERERRGATTLLDVREPAEYAGGHIPGALHIPLSSLAGRLAELDPEVPVVAYCKSGRRSRSAASLLSGRGFADAASLDGGIDAWRGQQATGTYAQGASLLPDDAPAGRFFALTLALEEGSRVFYEEAARTVAQGREVFTTLVRAEEEHRRILLEAAARCCPARTAGTGAEPWQGLMEGGVKVDAALAWLREPGRVALDAVEASMQIEVNSLDLYLKMAGRPSFQPAADLVDRLVAEERAHLALLGELIERLR